MHIDIAALEARVRYLESIDPELARHLRAEVDAQNSALKLIASENFCSEAVMAAMATPLNDKYAEGAPGSFNNGMPRRFYSGCENVDAIEELAVARAGELFGASYSYAQPHSGSDANLIAYWAILRTRVETAFLREIGALAADKRVPSAGAIEGLDQTQWNELRRRLGDHRILAMDLRAGGHLTHGSRQNITSRMFEVHAYGVTGAGLIDYDQLAAQAAAVKPLILIAGYSSYTRRIDFRRMRQIADDVGAVLMCDMAHFAGLVAGQQLTGDHHPVPFADVVTFTTHKTMRGPRGGMVLCTDEFKPAVERGCPMFHGGPMPHVIAAKAVCFGEALQPAFRDYAAQVITNARALGTRLLARGLNLVSGGTDNHLVVVDLRDREVNGYQAEEALRSCGLTLNRNVVPEDPRPPIVTSGLRLGTPATTTLGMGTAEMELIADTVANVVGATRPLDDKRGFELDPAVREAARAVVDELTGRFAPYRNVGSEAR